MRSRAEQALRAIALAALALALFQAIRARGQHPRTRILAPAELPAALASAVRALDTLALVADTALDPVYRDWLAAARTAGRGVRWRGDSIPALAIAIEPDADPAGGSRVLVAAPAGSLLRLADSAGALDSARALGGGVSFAIPRLLGSARARIMSQIAVAAAADSLLPRRIVVLGRPSWETKFVVAALEERGWPVVARIPLTPDTAVVQGARWRLDTASVSVVVALDATAVPEAARIGAFVRQGGGMILGPAAAAEPAFAALRPGQAGVQRPGSLLGLPAGDPRRGLPLAPVVALANDALALERRSEAIAVAARRIGAGRVLQLGYDESWLWRMTGPEGAVAAHRKWWSSLVASVAYRATLETAPGVSPDDAPRARMVARLGPADPALRPAPPGAAQHEGPAWWLGALALGALLAEWASRRLRGAP